MGQSAFRAVWSGDDWELGESAQDETVAVAPVELFEWNGEAELREPLEQGVECELCFHAREGGAEAEVDAVSEGEVPAVGSVDVECFGLRIAIRVPVG